MKCPWDDDEEITPDSITNYYFEDGNDEPVSYSVLPLLFSDDGDEVVPQTPKGGIFLHGEAGIAKFHRQVKAWRVDILGPAPEVLVLTKDDKWIRLVKPRRSFAEEIRTISIVVRCLHYLRRKPYVSEKLLWEHCRKVFSLYDFRPSEADVVDHLPLISMMMKRDEVLAKSKVLAGFLENKPKKRKSSPRQGGQADLGGKRFIVGDDEDVYESLYDAVGNDDDEESDLFDTVCAICDNGGELLCCEGICMRSFHPTIKAGGDSYCLSLGYTDAEVEAIQNFLCRNCQLKKHQCFICGKLGSSDKSVGAEVFQCSSVTCGHFYHPKCVAELLHPGNEATAAQHQKKIASGESFTCPLHKCIVCKRGENKEVEDLQFAICRRCPKAYHRKCLPETIAFEDKEKKDIVHRAWDDLLPNRILIYCLKHLMDEKLRTPIRNHIEFPDVPEKRKTSFQELRKNVLAKTKKAVSKEMSREEAGVRTKTPKILDKVSISVTRNDGSLKASSGQAVDLFNKQKAYKSTKKPSTDTGKSVLKTERHSVSVVNKITVREDKVKQLVASKGLDPAKHKGHVPCEIGSAASPFSALKESHSLSLVDKNMEKKYD
ncbi:hypothetical protein QJS04_geneDACA008097 [Acorus gramineus]|uniref:RING-type domain-containing protein n=1 Tax=Acorus gramineus TaxID=55184 RepID=A0AAV9B8T6_ACOGR|nr:hypothetical protein QJS04_geneDACA008097 [Acorus gramineus]